MLSPAPHEHAASGKHEQEALLRLRLLGPPEVWLRRRTRRHQDYGSGQGWTQGRHRTAATDRHGGRGALRGEDDRLAGLAGARGSYELRVGSGADAARVAGKLRFRGPQSTSCAVGLESEWMPK